MDEQQLFKELMSQLNQNAKMIPEIMESLRKLQYKMETMEQTVNLENIQEFAAWKQQVNDILQTWVALRDELTYANREYKWKFGQWEAKYSTLLWLLGIIMAAFWKEIASLIMN